MGEGLNPETRTAVIKHVLRELYPKREEGTILETVTLPNGVLVGVKVAPKGYISTAKYALVTVEDGKVINAKRCSGKTLRRELTEQAEE
ncbi:hypothetical protein [Halostella litorea]|uniref:hypothetical protein n=1 Tax=Halostella litorea TaxID=2528831 RepID=UPI00109242E8|nr:hypothetical protein [Halostella litorea]